MFSTTRTGLAALAAMLMATAAQAQTPLPAHVWLAWRKAGFEPGWMSASDSGFTFRLEKEKPTSDDLPAFRCNPWHRGMIAKVAPRTTAFGLYLRGSASDAALKELAGLQHLEQLQALDVSMASITDAGVRELANAPRLHTLDLRLNPGLSNAVVKELGQCKSLRSLYIDVTNATEAELKEMAASTVPLVAERNKVTPEALKELANLKQMQSLHLLCFQANDRDFTHLTELPTLRSLTLFGIRTTNGAGFKDLANHKQLQAVNFLHAKITGPALKPLGGLERLESLGFFSTPVTDADLRIIAEFERLQALRLSGTDVTGKGLQELGLLKNLRSLHLDRTKWTDAGMAEVAWLRQLQTLDVSRTSVTNKGLKHLLGLKHLRYLDLRGTYVTDAAELQQALPSLHIER